MERPDVEAPQEGTITDASALLDEDFSVEQEEPQGEELEQPQVGSSEEGYQQNIDLLLDVGLDLVVELGRVRMKIREILQLAPGSVIGLERLAGEPVDVLVNGHPIAKGEVVLLDENLGIRITTIITPIQRIQSLRER